MALLEAIGLLPPSLHRWIVDASFRNRATAVVTNLPGPRTPITLGGHTVSDLMFWVPQSAGIGLGLSIITYGGHGRIGVIADTARVAHARPLAEAVDAELRALGLG